MAVRVAQAQLERAVGGSAKLLQLIDRTDTGDLASVDCQAYLTDILAEGNGEVNGYVGLAVDLTDVNLLTAPELIRMELDVDVYLCWLRGTGGVTIPEQVQAAYERTIKQLELIRDRKRGVGLDTRPAASQDVTQVTKDDTEAYFSDSSPRKRFDGWS